MDNISARRIKIVMAEIIIACICVCAVVFWDMQKMKKIDKTDYTSCDQIRFSIDSVQMDSRILSIQGWAVHLGEEILTFDTFVVLHDMKTDTFYKIPTQFMDRSDVTENIGDGNNYNKCGFLANVLIKKLDLTADSYEICIAYENNNEKYFVHTGQCIGVQNETKNEK